MWIAIPVALIGYSLIYAGLKGVHPWCPFLEAFGAPCPPAPGSTSSLAGGLAPGGSAPAGTPPAGSPAGDGLGAQALAAARAFDGCEYLFGGTTCHPGIDCSGVTQKGWEAVGIALPHQSALQYAMVKAKGWGISTAVARNTPGALLFFIFANPPAQVHHVALSMGDGSNMFSSDHPGHGPRVEPISAVGGRLYGAGLPTVAPPIGRK